MKLDSSHLKSAEFSDGKIVIEFKGGVKCEFPDCSMQDYKDLCQAHSHGQHFAKHFRKRKFKKL